ncbi:hypothetical protein DPMN_087910 [Dreissena polymorpha]|uniref:Uncharacterized protein n=1 Tax=Dreissena polymorpha TaxID=45954 RepID=A0A9D4KU31_DREPO|nr:hypothetical protein DPMN_087796 [Dreissena polymorpha]KAH3845628.1 hypothetical protein DPMN_087910 [Dreissena polymorpha]
MMSHSRLVQKSIIESKESMFVYSAVATLRNTEAVASAKIRRAMLRLQGKSKY